MIATNQLSDYSNRKLLIEIQKVLLTEDISSSGMDGIPLEVDDLILRAKMDYTKALELLESEDFYDAAEKAWSAIEDIRKAFLVAAGMPYEKAKTVNYALPIFNALMRALGFKELLKNYEWFEYKLHIMGFYERLTGEDEIESIIRDNVNIWLNKMQKIVEKIKSISIKDVLDGYSKLIRLKQELLSKSKQIIEIRSQINSRIKEIAKKVHEKG